MQVPSHRIHLGSLGGYSTSQIQSMIVQSAIAKGVDPNLALAVANHESGFVYDATNYNPATSTRASSTDWGVFQLNDSTIATLGVSDPFDPQQNIDAGLSLLKQYSNQYNGDLTKILWAYSAGPGSVSSGNPPASLNAYVGAVTSYMDTQAPSISGELYSDPSAPSDGAGFSFAGIDLSSTPVLVTGSIILTVLLWSIFRR